jgi:hypothetical protein
MLKKMPLFFGLLLAISIMPALIVQRAEARVVTSAKSGPSCVNRHTKHIAQVYCWCCIVACGDSGCGQMICYKIACGDPCGGTG